MLTLARARVTAACRRLHRRYLWLRIQQLLCLADSLLTQTDLASTLQFERALGRATALRNRIDAIDQASRRG